MTHFKENFKVFKINMNGYKVLKTGNGKVRRGDSCSYQARQ